MLFISSAKNAIAILRHQWSSSSSNLLEIFTHPGHRSKALAPNHYNMVIDQRKLQISATYSNSLNERNSSNKQTNAAIKQTMQLKLLEYAKKPVANKYRLPCSNTTVHTEQEQSKSRARTVHLAHSTHLRSVLSSA